MTTPRIAGFRIFDKNSNRWLADDERTFTPHWDSAAVFTPENYRLACDIAAREIKPGTDLVVLTEME